LLFAPGLLVPFVPFELVTVDDEPLVVAGAGAFLLTPFVLAAFDVVVALLLLVVSDSTFCL